MKRHMIAFERDGARFGLRAVAVVLHEGYVLLHRAEADDFWAMPGGRVELLEPAAESLRREMREELDTDATVVRLLWMVENFFEYHLPCHELGLYFLTELGPDFPYYDKTRPFYGIENGPGGDMNLRLIFQWFPVDRLESERLFPTFLRAALRDVPAYMQHVVHYDVET